MVGLEEGRYNSLNHEFVYFATSIPSTYVLSCINLLLSISGYESQMPPFTLSRPTTPLPPGSRALRVVAMSETVERAPVVPGLQFRISDGFAPQRQSQRGTHQSGSLKSLAVSWRIGRKTRKGAFIVTLFVFSVPFFFFFFTVSLRETTSFVTLLQRNLSSCWFAAQSFFFILYSDFILS